jgi:hypothetical protein
MNFPYNVQVAYDDAGRDPWTTVAKMIDQHNADAFAFAVHAEGHRTYRVRRGTKVISTFLRHGEPQLHR